MKYENAKDVLPSDLVTEIQKYAAGKLLYVPTPSARRPWGAGTGYRRQLDERNAEIRDRFAAGVPIDSLADTYFLTPETVKKIVYRKKENLPMEIKEILKLYANGTPKRVEVVSEQPAYRAGDRDDATGIYLELVAEYAEHKTLVTVCDYVFATPERITQSANVIEAYRRSGYACPRILETLRGDPFAKIGYKGHDCVVFAQEYAEETRPCDPADCIPPYHDELLVAAAKVASLHLAGDEPSAYALFEPVTAQGGFEDYVAEYVSGDLKNEIMERFPALAEKYGEIEELVEENRRALRAIRDRLPTSLFQGELSEIRVDEDGRFQGFRRLFCEGGREACVNHFMRLAFFLSDRLGRVENGCDEVYDEGQRNARLDAFRRIFRVLSQNYRFTEKEKQAAPLLYRILLLGSHYYWSVTAFANGDEKRLSDFLDYLAKQLTENELDFPAILR